MLNRARNSISAAFVVPAFLIAAAPASGFDELWRARFGPSPGGNEEGLVAAADGEGNVYVAGTAQDLSYDGGTFMVMLKYASTGEILWTKYLHSYYDARPKALSVDAKGAAYVAAWWDDDDGDSRARLFKFDE